MISPLVLFCFQGRLIKQFGELITFFCQFKCLLALAPFAILQKIRYTDCNAHGITQGMYYKWRDQLLTDGAKLFDRGGVDRVRERLEHENRKLKETIGELTVELKKNDW